MSPVGMSTVASSSSIDGTLGRVIPFIDGTKAFHGERLLVLRASSRIGACGVRMTTRVGDEVVGVASKETSEIISGLGASICLISVI